MLQTSVNGSRNHLPKTLQTLINQKNVHFKLGFVKVRGYAPMFVPISWAYIAKYCLILNPKGDRKRIKVYPAQFTLTTCCNNLQGV